VPSKDTGVDLRITDRQNKHSSTIQVKFSKDFLVTHGHKDHQEKLVSCGWWTLNREKIKKHQQNTGYGRKQASQFVI
jgi:ribonuclease BN (tRNA processing enzyme)